MPERELRHGFLKSQKKQCEQNNNPKDLDKVKSNDSLKDFINENLTESQTEKLKEVLSDENKTKELLNSDLAKQLFKKLTGGDFNGRP